MNWFELRAVLARPIAFHRVFATIGGGVCAGVFLSQLFYWSTDDRPADPDGWIYKTSDEWEEETALTRTQQDTVRKKLRSVGLLEEKLEGMPARLFYRLNKENLLAAVSKVVEEKRLKAAQGHRCVNPANKMRKSCKQDAQILQTNIYTETTNRDYFRDVVVAPSPQTTTATATAGPAIEVEVLEPEEEQKTETVPSEQQCSDLATTRETAHEEESSAAPDAEILKQVERVAHSWKLRPWRSSSNHIKPEMIRAVWQCNPGYYSLQGTQTPNQHHILKTVQLLERQLKSLDAAAVNAYHELMRYWQTAQVLANPEVQDAFVAAATHSKEQQKQAEWKHRAQAMSKILEDL